MKKITLAVLFGGSSTEYEISLQSAHAVLTHLDRDRYEPVLLGITRDGRWLLYQGPVDALLDAQGFRIFLISVHRKKFIFSV